MAKQTIDIGSSPNKGDGDPIRVAFDKINKNFEELYDGNFAEPESMNSSLIPRTTNTFDLGSTDKKWADLHLSDFLYINGQRIEALPNGSLLVNGNNVKEDTIFGADGTVSGDIIPDINEAYDLGSNTHRFRDLYLSGSTIDLGGTTLNVVSGELRLDGIKIPTVMDLIEGITVNNTGDLQGSVFADDSTLLVDAVNGSIPYSVLSDTPTIPEDVSELTDTQGLLEGGLPTVTVPGIAPTTYKGLQVAYGVIHSNSNTSELNVSKIVIHKPAYTTVTIDPTGSQDDFRVSGIDSSDVLAMFVVYGDVNGPKDLATLQAFAEAAIDNVVLDGGVEGEFNTVDEMKAAFAANYATLAVAAGGLVANFQFFEVNNTFTVSANLTGQGTGSGFNINNLSYNLDTDTVDLSGWSNGSGYSANDVIVIPGTSISYEGAPLVSPDNDVTVTITSVNVSGNILTYTVSGTLPRPEPQWPTNFISDGGADQYDSANYISTNLASEISYNDGNTVADGTAAFGAGSSYSFAYQDSIFALFVTGNGASLVRTSGNSGADGNSTTEAGNIYDVGTPEQEVTNAVTHINIIGDPWASPIISFTKTDGGDEVDILIEDDGEGAGVGITRDSNQGIYNPYREGSWNDAVSPGGTLWNTDGWDDFSNVESRIYLPLYEAFGSGGLGNKIVGAECVMYLPDNGKYYAVKFDQWTQGGGGGFAYTRRELDLTSLEEGIKFADGTRLKSAEGVGRIKSTASNNRRIEEVVGSKTVSVSERTTNNITTTASRSVTNSSQFWVATADSLIDEIINNPSSYNVTDNSIQFSLDNVTWYSYDFGYSNTGTEIGVLVTTSVSYNQGDTVYFRYDTGGTPVVWWDKNELPSGGNNFRGAVIDYHAYTGESTIIGTIHIVDDDGEENITHTEVASGSTDGENDDLWLVQNEGTISYRRIDGEGKTVSVHWTAKVFYSSQYYND
jgi:hypothetical protein